MSGTYLLDTQVLLLWRSGADSLGRGAARVLGDDKAKLLLSVASVWEIAIKRSIGKLSLDLSTQEFVETAVAAGISLHPIRPEHAYRTESLPWHHRDPFDRLLVAQALVDNLEVVTGDPRFRPYGVGVVW
ncbi:MAG: type II toxin-antitoxin system VapC family toxin [Deltaproteobacteria bacterium]|nr:type II toxin-antitoxin system VapC family toxin [Deltaproteobacteria bacterium]